MLVMPVIIKRKQSYQISSNRMGRRRVWKQEGWCADAEILKPF